MDFMKKKILLYILGIAILLQAIYLIHFYKEYHEIPPKKAESSQEKALNPVAPQKNRQEIPPLIASTIHEYEDHLQKNPKDVQAHLALGQICLTIVPKQEQAGRHLTKVLELSPDHPKKEFIQKMMEKLKQRENKKKLEEKK